MSLLTEVDFSEELCKQLMFTRLMFDGTVKSVKVYKRIGNKLLVPKRFMAHHLGVHQPPHHLGVHAHGPSLRDHQIIPAGVVLATLQDCCSALVHLCTGYGKTVIALWVVANLRPVSTIVYVHKLSLQLQWQQSIAKFLSEDAGSVCVRTVQSQLNRIDEISQLGPHVLVIFDEVHHMCADTFSKLLTHSNAEWHMGLSATETRPDGLQCVLHSLLGSPCVSITDLQQKPHVHASWFDGPPDLYEFKTRNVKGRPVVQYADAITRLCTCPRRNDHITSILQNLDGRNVLILTSRRSHVKVLHDLMSPSGNARMLVGGMSEEEIALAVAPGVNILLFATVQAAGEGFDMPQLDTVVFATPLGSVRQETGRVLRCKGTHVPLVIDIVDKAPMYIAQYRKRKAFYDEQGLLYIQLPEQ